MRFGEPVAYFAGVGVDVCAGFDADAADYGGGCIVCGEEEVVWGG